MVAVESIDRLRSMVYDSKKKTRAGIFQPALRVRVGRGWEFQTRTRPAGNPPRQTRGYAQPVIIPIHSTRPQVWWCYIALCMLA